MLNPRLHISCPQSLSKSLKPRFMDSLYPFFRQGLLQNRAKTPSLSSRIDAIIQRRPPKHVALIMDGNRRWAKQRGLNAYKGHLEGAKRLVQLLEWFPKLGIQTVTLYAFSTENWKRTPKEIAALFKIFEYYLSSYTQKMIESGVRLKVIGDRSALSSQLNRRISESEERTKEGKKLNCLIAINYGGRNELIRAIKNWYDREIATGASKASELSEESFGLYLDTWGFGDPDLVIRTSGHQRVSNFLLWQMAYAEILSVKALWPDFTLEHLLECVEQYQDSERRYGK